MLVPQKNVDHSSTTFALLFLKDSGPKTHQVKDVE